MNAATIDPTARPAVSLTERVELPDTAAIYVVLAGDTVLYGAMHRTESEGIELASRNGHTLLPGKPTEHGPEWHATTCMRCRRCAQSNKGRILVRGTLWMRRLCRSNARA